MGREKCDLVIKNVNIFNVFTGETALGAVGIADGRIVGFGNLAGKREYDGGGKYLLPSFLDAHIHIESSLLSPEAFAVLAVRNGTGTVIADPHEIVNVCGVAGAEYLWEALGRLSVDGVQPLGIKMQLPSCVPATPFETSGAAINGRETEAELSRELFHGLGEMMNFPGVLQADEDTARSSTATLPPSRATRSTPILARASERTMSASRRKSSVKRRKRACMCRSASAPRRTAWKRG